MTNVPEAPATPIDKLSLNTRTSNSLHRVGLDTIEEIIATNVHELLKIPNFGQGSLDNLRLALLRAGYPEPTGACPTCGRSYK